MNDTVKKFIEAINNQKSQINEPTTLKECDCWKPKPQKCPCCGGTIKIGPYTPMWIAHPTVWC